MNPSVNDTARTGELAALELVAEDIRSMKIRGAGRIARAASEALSALARDYHGGSYEGLLEALRSGARTLMGTRPTAVSLRNALLMTLSNAELAPDLGSLRAEVMERSSRFVTGSLSAVDRIARNGKVLIDAGSRVMTHCNSDAALSLIEAAFTDGRVNGVIATESRPWRQGHLTVRRLASKGMPVTLIVDSASNSLMAEVGAVVIGADTITADGHLVNKIGTSMVALAARNAGVPVIVCAETYKFSMWAKKGSDVVIEDRGPEEVADPLSSSDLPGVSFLNPVFDITPPDHITHIVTEDGIISPRDAASVIERMAAMMFEGGNAGPASGYWFEGL
ncbi:MAG: ribose 1,5-bisphosphate isomerase [Candidatus Thermoplasmatota archaeon]|nr:ribose 1,5-bisphosphate isomerase [Candidatus Thermoplasmatota archaeon]